MPKGRRVVLTASSWQARAGTAGLLGGRGGRRAERGESGVAAGAHRQRVGDVGRGAVLLDPVAVDGVPAGVQHAPSAGATDPVTPPSHGTFTAARGGVYLWHVPTA